jgi:hypothetical protein
VLTETAALNLSSASSIKNGSVNGSGASMSLDEDKFSSSDLNAVTSVKCINREALRSLHA